MQSVNLAFNSSVLYAAGEPETPSVDYLAEQHFPGDLVALRAQTRSYAVTSQIPALSPTELAALPGLGSHPDAARVNTTSTWRCRTP